MNELYLNGTSFDLDHHFRLDKKFLGAFKNKKPDFGFNGLGELVFYRTYSRIMPDGKKEAFIDTLTRVTEGCYEVQRRHCVRLHIPWDKKKAQRSAQEMFQRMWDFKFLPPGRGLWMMGTEFMWSRGSASLNNCFDAKTEIITRDGIKPIGDLVGTEQELLTTGGKWVKAPIKSFGVQELYKLTLERSGVEKVVYTTAGHRWFAKDRRKTQTVVEDTTGVVVKKRQSLGYKELATVELNEHHTMRSVYGNGINGNIRPSAFGIAHGIAFGDGTTGQDSESCGTYLYLCGSKNEELLEYFPNCPTSFDAAKGSEGAARVADLPRFFRRKPQLRESKSYLYGWLAGYFAADGTINKKGNQVVIASSNYENMLLVRDVCAVLGIGTNSISQTTQTVLHNGVKKKFTGYKIGLVAAHLNSEFFLLSEHKKRFNEHSSHRNRPIYKWRVKSVEQTGEFAEVYCAQVPSTQAFVLADNILTGNCAFVSTSGLSEADPAEPFCFLMDMSMLGVGVGFDTKGAGHIKIGKPANKTYTYVVDDNREGWVDSLRHLIASYTNGREDGHVEFDYSKIRPEGSLINGFGGKASGSRILVELHDLVREHLTRCIGKTLSSVDITDLMNYIGRCVVAGNVRRCLPKGTLVHLKRGLVPIEQVQVGDLVLTADGYYPVAENVQQGVQNVVTINSQLGQFRCTDRHRIAVMDGIGSYKWKRANQLCTGDRMVFVDAAIAGVETVLPGHSSIDGQSMLVPVLDNDVAWFIGAIHGDGYVYRGRRYGTKRNHGASLSIAINQDENLDGIREKLLAGFEAFGHKPKLQKSDDNCLKFRVTSRKLAYYFDRHIKRSKESINVPECIRLGRSEIRSAYLAGLLDTDGSTKNRPTTLLTTVYRDFARQVQAVYSSLGIPTKLRLRKKADQKGQAKWDICLVGDFAIAKFKQSIQPHAVKQVREMKHASGHDFGYPSEWIDRESVDYGKSWSPQQDQMTYQRALLCEARTNGIIPIEVESIIDEGISVETYDLSVPDRSEFVAEGLLVHNTAEIAFGEADDPDYCNMKNPLRGLMPEEVSKFYACTGKIYAAGKGKGTLEDFKDSEIPEERLIPAIETWNALNHHRWASNNSIFAKVGMDYSSVGNQIAVNGEPGLMWLDNARNYGRFIDGKQPGIDGRVMGSNPCFAGHMRLLTREGYRTIEDMWRIGGEHLYASDKPLADYGTIEIVNRLGVVSATNVYKTDDNAEIFKVLYDDGQSIEATSNHRFVVVRDEVECIVHLADLAQGDMSPLATNASFGAHEDRETALLAGWVIGDGSLSPQRNGQLTAHVTCYADDVDDVMPVLKQKLHEVYDANVATAGIKPSFEPWHRMHKHFSHAQSSIRSNVLGRLLRESGIESGSKHRVPNFVWGSNAETVSAFLRGLFSADGSVQANQKKGTMSVRLTQANRQLLCDCQLLLSQFRIHSKVLSRRKPRLLKMNDGNGGMKEYKTQEMFELIISRRSNVVKFAENIGFIQARKNDKLSNWLDSHGGPNNSADNTYRKVVSIEYVGTGATYCLTEPQSTLLTVQGQVIGNCVEQSLESYELCCLVETFPAHHDDAEDFLRTLKFAYLYAKTVTLLPTHNARTNQVMLRNRRIGLSQSGIVQAYAKFGRRKMLMSFSDAGYSEVRKWDSAYSEWLCVPKSIKVTSIKPSGTVSLLVGATPGIHHPEASTYWRRVRIAKDSVLVQILKDAGYHVEPAISDPDRTVVVKFAINEPNLTPVGKTTIWQQMTDVVDYHRYWADNQVSATVKFKTEEKGEIEKVLSAYEDQIKGVSFLPLSEHGYVQAPYEACTAEEVESYNSNLKDADYSAYIYEAIGSKGCDGEACEFNSAPAS